MLSPYPLTQLKATKLFSPDFLFRNLCWVLPFTLFSIMFGNSYHDYCSITWPGTDLSLMRLLSPRSSFLATAVTFVFSQSLRNFPQLPQLFKDNWEWPRHDMGQLFQQCFFQLPEESLIHYFVLIRQFDDSDNVKMWMLSLKISWETTWDMIQPSSETL